MLALSEAVDDVGQVLSTLRHEDNQHSLEISVVLDDVLLERLETVVNSNQQAVSAHLKVVLLGTDQVCVTSEV